MAATITFNPIITSNAAGSFNVQSEGYIQGMALDQPSIRNRLSGGVLAASETLPMWGGVGISEEIPTPANPNNAPNDVLGSIITRALQNPAAAPAAGDLLGFSVFDQAHHMINSPQSPVPLASTGMSVHFYRMGSGARIAVNCASALSALVGQGTNAQVSWDFTNQQLIPFATTALKCLVLGFNFGNSMVVSYASGTGFATWVRNGNCAIIQI